MDLFSDKQMEDLDPLQQADKAIRHTLTQIRDNAVVGYHMGLGTQTFALLTECAATLREIPIPEVRKEFKPRCKPI